MRLCIQKNKYCTQINNECNMILKRTSFVSPLQCRSWHTWATDHSSWRLVASRRAPGTDCSVGAAPGNAACTAGAAPARERSAGAAPICELIRSTSRRPLDLVAPGGEARSAGATPGGEAYEEQQGGGEWWGQRRSSLPSQEDRVMVARDEEIALFGFAFLEVALLRA
jgi:hypothetical protein